MRLYKSNVKPTFDFLTAALVLLLFWPLGIILLFINKIVFGSSVFIQQRIGRNRKPFKCLKFRTFKNDGDEESIPRWGKFLRHTSLDEIPQVINVLRGDMSLIGPRPLLPQYLEEYSEEQMKRHLVKPGITGLAQVKGRNKLTWEESLGLDTYYAENVSAWLDFKILVKTIPQVFKFGEVQESHHTSRTAFKKKHKE